jgi:protein TonB
MIACRTVADFRVDDCVAVGESRGSQLVRAMLAAAWQFRVRPPRIGGRLQVGEWVRIRIDYGVRQRNAWEQDRN